MERKQPKSKDKEKQKPPEDLEILENMLALIRPRIGILRGQGILNDIKKKELEDLIEKEKKATEQIEKLKNKGV